jgi:cobalt-zinc-cadmium efflux system protein
LRIASDQSGRIGRTKLGAWSDHHVSRAADFCGSMMGSLASPTMSNSHAHHGTHRHDHGHGPGASFDRAFAVGIALNLGFVSIEAAFGWWVDSLALLADAVHNLSDVAGLVLAWGGALAGRRQPDARHTYGWKRASILAAFLNALLLLVAMGSLGWEAAQRLRAPQATDGMIVMAVAGLGIVVNGATAWLFARGRHGDLNVRGAFLHMAADALVSAGVVIGGAVSLFAGWVWIDPVVTLLIVLVVVVGTWDLFRRSLHLLFDGVPDELDTKLVHERLAALPGVSAVHDLHVWAMSSSEVALTAHLVMPGGAPGDAFLRNATADLAQHFGIGHVTLQVVQAPFTVACADRSPADGHRA